MSGGDRLLHLRVQRSLDIVVPVRNEEDSIDEFYRRVRALGLSESLIFVDNASSDGTVTRIQRLPDVRLIRHDTDQGYGASICHGIAASNGDVIIVIDADLEYPPETIEPMLAALEEHAVVYASRFLQNRPDMPVVRRIGNRFITALYNLYFGQHITDSLTGLKGLRRDAVRFSSLELEGFEHVMELGALIAVEGHRIHEVPVHYVPRMHGRSKMRHLREVFKFQAYLTAYWFRCVVLRRPLHRRARDE